MIKSESLAQLGEALSKAQCNPMSKLFNVQVEEIRTLCRNGASQASVARQFGVSPMTVSRIVNMQTWSQS